MKKTHTDRQSFDDFPAWDKLETRRFPLSFELEITDRCNLDCRHCFINLPASDKKAQSQELSLEEIKRIVDEAVDLGALWCLITGGEPLLRLDFEDIYLYLKRKGLLVSIFTNAALVTETHADLFKKYPPRDIEISIYGISEEIFGKVTRRPEAFKRFKRGLDVLEQAGVKVRLKAMFMRSNIEESEEIAAFCRKKTKDFYRFDPLLILRYDRNEKRNAEIKSERLSPEEIVKLERGDPERFNALEKKCLRQTRTTSSDVSSAPLFRCGAGSYSFSVSSKGMFRLCSALWHPDCLYDLRQGSLKEAWEDFTPSVLSKTSDNPEYLNNCQSCPLVDLCLWCPAHIYLETGEMDRISDDFCRLAQARSASVGKRQNFRRLNAG
jgi:radical SAM protein with 4Fe4S-binding SPASM domain